MSAKSKMRLLAASLALPSLFIAGCSGGSSSGGSTNPTPTPGVSTNLVALTNTNTLLRFNAQSPGTTSTLSIAGLPQTQRLLGIDYRYAPDAAGQAGLYALAGNGSNFQLYRLAINGSVATATAVGATFAAPLNATDGVGFDFNPNVPSPTDATVRVDRIRVVSTSRGNIRVVPNTGALVDNDGNPANGIQPDGTLTYDTTDQNANVTPRIVGAAYTNNDTDLSTGTVNYALDSANGNLVTQGRPEDPNTTEVELVSPNTGRLFTVGNTGLTLDNETGFDIAPTSNLALLNSGNRLYTINLSSGATTSLGNINVPSGTVLRGLAVLPGSTTAG